MNSFCVILLRIQVLSLFWKKIALLLGKKMVFSRVFSTKKVKRETLPSFSYLFLSSSIAINHGKDFGNFFFFFFSPKKGKKHVFRQVAFFVLVISLSVRY